MSFGANKQKVTTAVSLQEAGNGAQQDLYVLFRSGQFRCSLPALAEDHTLFPK
jgi:hypothetical protein